MDTRLFGFIFLLLLSSTSQTAAAATDLCRTDDSKTWGGGRKCFTHMHNVECKKNCKEEGHVTGWCTWYNWWSCSCHDYCDAIDCHGWQDLFQRCAPNPP